MEQDSNKTRYQKNLMTIQSKVTSSNFSRNDGTMRIFTHFRAKNHSKSPITGKNLIQ